jgi:glutamate-1-semialdehyde 2,1-aminomutase
LEVLSMANYMDVYRQKTPLSEKLFKRAREVMPGGVCHNLHYFAPYPLFVKGAKGSRFRDVDDHEYVDLWMGHYTHILGHHPDIITEAVQRQAREGIHWGIVFEKQVEWAELVQQLIPSAERVRFCCSGTEATMYVARLARAFTGKRVLLKIAGGWHGANPDLTFAIKWPYETEESLGLLPDLQQHTKAIPFNDIEASLDVIRRNRNDLAGIILEPIVGEAGFIPATMDYLKMLRSETEASEALLIFDEVITGFRASLGGAQQRFNVIPDLTTLGKVAAGGFPVGAVVGKKNIMERVSPEMKVGKSERILIGGGTFSSHPFSVAAGLAMLRTLRDHQAEVYPLLEAKGQKVRKGLQEVFEREGIHAVVTGIGSLFQTHFPFKGKRGVTIASPHAINQHTDVDKREGEFRIRMLNHGVHLMHGGGALSIAHSDEDIEKIFEAAGKVAREMARDGG